MSLFQQSSRNPPVSSCSFNLFSFILSYFLLFFIIFSSVSGSFIFFLRYLFTLSPARLSSFQPFTIFSSLSIYIRRGQSTFPLSPSSPCLSDTNFFYQSHSSLFFLLLPCLSFPLFPKLHHVLISPSYCNNIQRRLVAYSIIFLCVCTSRTMQFFLCTSKLCSEFSLVK